MIPARHPVAGPGLDGVRDLTRNACTCRLAPNVRCCCIVGRSSAWADPGIGSACPGRRRDRHDVMPFVSGHRHPDHGRGWPDSMWQRSRTGFPDHRRRIRHISFRSGIEERRPESGFARPVFRCDVPPAFERLRVCVVQLTPATLTRLPERPSRDAS